MSKKAKPIKDLKNIVDSIDVPKTLLTEIREKCNIMLDDEGAQKLLTASKFYLHDKDILNKLPRPNEIKAAIEEAKKKAIELNDILKQMDFVSRHHLVSRLGEGILSCTMEDMNRMLQRLILACEDALESIPIDKGGRPKDHALNNYIEILASIFHTTTGQLPTVTWNEYANVYQGDFYSFVSTCLNLIDPKSTHRNHGLGERLKHVLKRLKSISSQIG